MHRHPSLDGSELSFLIPDHGRLKAIFAAVKGAPVRAAAVIGAPVTPAPVSAARIIAATVIATPVIAATVIAMAALSSLATHAHSEPFVEFLGQTFYIAKAEMDGSGDVAFDPLNRRVLSVALTDPCGGDPQTPAADQGAAWDPVDEKFWIITQQREVKVWNGTDLDLLFTIPEVFDVPGVGPDTLESVRGIALDETHMYVVDAGPDFGEIESNAWFKFTRDGTPVASSKATDFIANLDLAPDALVDGIYWIPPEAPYGQGLFLVTLEHSGIQVIDEDGFFVDEIVWEHEGIPQDAVPFAFSGVTMDPTTGDLYLVENSGAQMFTWVRLPEQDPTPVVYSIGAPQLRIHHPTGECNRRTFYPTGSENDIFFSLAYRQEDGKFWTSDFNSGELFLLDPRSGIKASSSFSGPANVWGMAYDEGDDLLYLQSFGDHQLHAFSPETGIRNLLPAPIGFPVSGLAFRPQDSRIYGVSAEATPELIRIDPSTGAGTVVGTTTDATGLAYDVATDRLIGISSDDKLYAIDPLTGAFEEFEDVSNEPHSWEALGIIPHGGAASNVDPHLGADSNPERQHSHRARLSVTPNPTVGPARVRFATPLTHEATVQILDAAGRLVRTVRPATDGDLFVDWDGLNREGRPVPVGVYLFRTTKGLREGRVVILR